jgi:hypothetical protein
MYIQGITHAAIEVASPTRTEMFLRDVFGLQTLHQGYWKGEYVRIMGSPDPNLTNPRFVIIYLRPGLARGRLNHVGFDVGDQGVPAAAQELRAQGTYVDLGGDYTLYGPEELRVRLESLTVPLPFPDDPTVRLEDCQVDPNLPCMVNRISHVALDVGAPTRMQN